MEATCEYTIIGLNVYNPAPIVVDQPLDVVGRKVAAVNNGRKFIDVTVKQRPLRICKALIATMAACTAAERAEILRSM